jgi:hypothetical protein
MVEEDKEEEEEEEVGTVSIPRSSCKEFEYRCDRSRE